MAMVNPNSHPTQWWLASLIPYGSHLKSQKQSVDFFGASLSYQNPIQTPPIFAGPIKISKIPWDTPIFAGFCIPNEGDHPIKIPIFADFRSEIAPGTGDTRLLRLLQLPQAALHGIQALLQSSNEVVAADQ